MSHNSIENISTAQYTLDQQTMALNESIPLEREFAKAGASSKTLYGQFMAHPKSAR